MWLQIELPTPPPHRIIVLAIISAPLSALVLYPHTSSLRLKGKRTVAREGGRGGDGASERSYDRAEDLARSLRRLLALGTLPILSFAAAAAAA